MYGQSIDPEDCASKKFQLEWEEGKKSGEGRGGIRLLKEPEEKCVSGEGRMTDS